MIAALLQLLSMTVLKESGIGKNHSGGRTLGLATGCSLTWPDYDYELWPMVWIDFRNLKGM